MPVFVVALVLLALQAVLGSAVRRFSEAGETPLAGERSEPWSARAVEALSLGQMPAVIDWIWLRGFVDQADRPHVAPGKHSGFYYDLLLVTELDPAHFSAYRAGSTFLTVVRNDNLGALDVAERGERFYREGLGAYPPELREERWSEAWQLPLLRAYLWLFEFDDISKAGEAFVAAGSLEGAPEYVRKLEKRFREPGGPYDVGMRLINFLISSASSEKEKERLVAKRESLHLSQYLFHLRAQFREFVDALPPRAKGGSRSALWERFRRETRVPEKDPWGGKLSLLPDGRIESTTPRVKVFGLD